MRYALLIVCLLFAGCDGPKLAPATPSVQSVPDQPRSVIPRAVMPEGIRPGDRVTFESEVRNGISTTDEKASGVGASVKATGDKANAEIESTAPGVALSTGGSASGGDTISKLSAQITDNQRQLACIVLGAIGLGLGAWMFARGNKQGLPIAGVGAGLVAAGMMPAWFWPILGVCVLAALGFWLWTAQQAGNAKKYASALKVVTAGVDSAPDMAKKMVKEEVSKKADKSDKDTIREFTE